MSAPSVEHEDRVALLDTLARLAGFSSLAGLPGLRPDVVRRRQPSWLFIGDAKHTERPDDFGTRLRIGRYFRHGSHHVGRGGSLVVALCVPSDPLGWHDLIKTSSARCSCSVERSETMRIDGAGIIVWVASGIRSRRRATPVVKYGECGPRTTFKAGFAQ